MQRAKICLCAALFLAPALASAQAVIYQPDFVESAPSAPAMQSVTQLVHDGDIIFIRCPHSVYAVKILRQTINPEQMHFAYLKVGSGLPPITAQISKTFPGGLHLDFFTVPWSGWALGAGYIYLTAGHGGLPPAYEIGQPFESGDLKDFEKTVPADIKFESLPSTGWGGVMAR